MVEIYVAPVTLILKLYSSGVHTTTTIPRLTTTRNNNNRLIIIIRQFLRRRNMAKVTTKFLGNFYGFAFSAQLAELFIQAGQNAVCRYVVCVDVNEGGTNRNRCTYLLMNPDRTSKTRSV